MVSKWPEIWKWFSVRWRKHPIGKPTGWIKLRSQTPVGQSRSCGRKGIRVIDCAVNNTCEQLTSWMDGSLLHIATLLHDPKSLNPGSFCKTTKSAKGSSVRCLAWPTKKHPTKCHINLWCDSGSIQRKTCVILWYFDAFWLVSQSSFHDEPLLKINSKYCKIWWSTNVCEHPMNSAGKPNWLNWSANSHKGLPCKILNGYAEP